MFTKILIANRGEIACRVIETARAMGMATVAVYSDADASAKHVALADEAVRIGPPAPAQSYLRGDAIIQAALATGAQAIHPGYGFLSENPDFVDAVEAAGLVFIGPSADTIRALGLKDAAKALMEQAGVPVVPGYHGANQDPGFLAEAAEAIGYPVMIKAVAGGGGKGMRQVARAEEFGEALAAARGEAKTAFGNDAVLIEKLVARPRHIEVQVFGDGERAVHLFERDCSLQRRHQKVMEEAPAPGMTAEMRAAMGAAAVRAAEAVGYIGAGTVEFIVDASEGLGTDRFWFMEMNTRLQVEHPVTEAVTGVDLVEWQLRVAAGESLPARQCDLAIKGHAFEARIYAEDATNGFLPVTGRLAHLQFAQGARVDSGVRVGDEISPWYDPMIAKIIVHGPTRDIALRRLERALSTTEVAGSALTNLEFLLALTRQAGVVAGQVDTGLIARSVDALAAVPEPTVPVLALAALGAAGLSTPGRARDGFSLWAPLSHNLRFQLGAREIAAVLRVLAPGEVEVEVEGHLVHCERRSGAWWVDGRKFAASLWAGGGLVSVFDGHGHHFTTVDPLARESDDAETGNFALAPMPGLVKAVFVTAGQVVKAGQRLAVMEAMKMEHTLRSSRRGMVAEVLIGAGAQVEAGAALIRLEDEMGASA